MNRLTKFFVSLYPTAWRNRYESEFAALLEELNPKWRSSLDILKGAITMQLRTVSFGKIVIATGLVGLLLGLCAWLVIPNRYVSMSLIRINSPKELLTDRVLVMAQAALSRSALNTLVQKYDLYPQQRAKLPLEDILNQMRDAIRISPVQAFSHLSKQPFTAVHVEFIYSDPAKARLVVQDLTTRFDGEILDAPSLDRSPISPNWKPLAFIGLLAGLLSGLLLALILRRRPKPA